MIEFFVAGIPKTAGSKKAFMRPGMRFPVVVDDCKKGKDWKASVGFHAANAHKGPPMSGPLCVSLDFCLPRPKSHYRTGKNAGVLRDDAPTWHTSKPDALKMARAVEDACTGILWVDDSQICEEKLTKRYGDNPGCRVRVDQSMSQTNKPTWR